MRDAPHLVRDFHSRMKITAALETKGISKRENASKETTLLSTDIDDLHDCVGEADFADYEQKDQPGRKEEEKAKANVDENAGEANAGENVAILSVYKEAEIEADCNG